MMSRSRSTHLWLVLTCAGALFASCDQSVDDGRLDSTAGDTVAQHDGQAGEHPAGDGGTADGKAVDGAAGKTVKVTYKAQSTVVSLAQPTPVTFLGTKHARLWDVIQLAVAGVTQDKLTADFVSSDGFKPGSKSNCAGLVPVPGANLAKGYIDVSTRRLSWDPSLGYPGCLSVQDLAEILVADKP